MRVSGVLLDITVEREEQFRLQQRLERLRTVFDYTYQFAGLLSRDGVLLESNRTALKAAGVTLNDAVGKLFWETPFWAQQPAAEIARLRDGIERAGRGEFVRFQYQTEHTRGAVRIVDFSLLPVFDDEGEVVWILSEGRDVTDIVNAHKALRTLEDRLAVATSSANLGLWDVNLQTGDAWLNDRWWTMLGYEPQRAEPQLRRVARAAAPGRPAAGARGAAKPQRCAEPNFASSTACAARTAAGAGSTAAAAPSRPTSSASRSAWPACIWM